MLILVKRAWGIRDILKSFEDPGRRKGKTKGTHLDEAVALRQSVALCALCKSGFTTRGKDYVASKKFPFVSGKCDACKEFDGRLFLYMPIENAHVMGADV